jgi:hypothetical protein
MKIKRNLFFFLTILIGSVFLQSCEKSEIEQNDELFNTLENSLSKIILENSYEDILLFKSVNSGSSQSIQGVESSRLQKAIIMHREFNQACLMYKSKYGIDQLNKDLIKIFKENVNHQNNTDRFITETRSNGTPCYDKYESEMLFNIGIFMGCTILTGGLETLICAGVFIHDSKEDADTFHSCCGC